MRAARWMPTIVAPTGPARRRVYAPLLLAVVALLATDTRAAAARPDPTDACLARRLDAAAVACRAMVGAWATSDGARRARRGGRAERVLAQAWAAAGRRAARQGAACGERAPDVGRVATRLAEFAASHAAALDAGASSPPADRRCVSTLLRSAGRLCGAVLAGEARRRRALAGDPGASAETRATRRARQRLRAAFARAACPTSLDAAAAERAVAGLGLGVAVSLTRPNILWLVAEDMNLELGAYGDPVARTPALDALAAGGARYTHAFTTAGVCAPSRTALITGMYATSLGAHHMRSIEGGYYPVPPPEVKAFPEYLRAAGYYTSNAGKQDYQFSEAFGGGPFTIWDATDPGADWRGRAEGQPFFHYATFLSTHESRLLHDETPATDPATVPVPAYYPDGPVIRRDIAQHYDNVAVLDGEVAALLARLDADGLAADTLVLFFGDNGRGMPRDKRWVYDGGIHVALMARWPGELDGAQVRSELVSLVDLAPTMLAIAGVEVPAHMQGRVFLGRQAAPAPPYVFAAADRHDEATDRIRAVRDARWAYVRNHQPNTPYGQDVGFRNLLQSMQEILRLGALHALVPPADWYFRQTKPVEELYDVDADPEQVVNLAADPAHADVLLRMRRAHDDWVSRTNDLGAVPEAELAERFWPGGAQPTTATPVIAPAGGALGGPVSVTCATAGASIGYTLESGDDAHWRLYTGPLTLEGGGTLRARAIRYGFAESAEAQATFGVP